MRQTSFAETSFRSRGRGGETSVMEGVGNEYHQLGRWDRADDVRLVVGGGRYAKREVMNASAVFVSLRGRVGFRYLV